MGNKHFEKGGELDELKTLKNIGQSKRKCCSIEEDYNNICEKCLKAEAIKWVKAIIKEQYDLGNFIKGSKNNAKHFNPRKQGQVTWIKHFFNITEEDLQ